MLVAKLLLSGKSHSFDFDIAKDGDLLKNCNAYQEVFLNHQIYKKLLNLSPN